MKRLATLFLLSLACGAGKYKAPAPLPSIALPTGDKLNPYDPAKPGLARPAGMADLNGKAWVALNNMDAGYMVRGPGFLAAVVPSTGATALIDLGGADERRCKNAGFVRVGDNKLYVTCAGDYSDGSGTAIVEVDPIAGAVTRSVSAPISPAGVAAAPTRIWFGDGASGHLYPIDKASFAVTGAPVPIQCPAAGYSTTNDVAVIGGDLYAICSNDQGGVLSRLDASTGAAKGTADIGPIGVALTQTGDGRIAIVSGGDNKLRLVTVSGTKMTVEVAYTFAQATSLQDVRARDQFLFTVASGTNTVEKIDLSSGAKLLAEVNVGDGAGPWNILPLDDDQAIVSNWMSNTLVGVKWPH